MSEDFRPFLTNECKVLESEQMRETCRIDVHHPLYLSALHGAELRLTKRYVEIRICPKHVLLLLLLLSWGKLWVKHFTCWHKTGCSVKNVSPAGVLQTSGIEDLAQIVRAVFSQSARFSTEKRILRCPCFQSLKICGCLTNREKFSDMCHFMSSL